MKRTISFLKTMLFLIVMGTSTHILMAQSFVHPGILHKQSDFDRMKANLGNQPWKGSYDKLVASPQAQLSWTPRATATIIRGGTGDNVSLLYNDVQAAYQHALLWKITGNTAHGNKARDILNAWSATHTTLTGNADRYLASGIFGYQFANAAEMMRGYSGFDINRFKNYMLNVFYYPLVERFLVGNSFGSDHNDACITNYWANWDLANMAAMVAIGVLCDNRTIYNKGIEYFKTGAGNSRGGGNGVIGKAVPFIHSEFHGQWQESGRDQGHSILGVGLMACLCEIAWNQGDNMYGYDNNRFRKGAEYVAKYNMGQSVPFTKYSWGSGTNCAYNEQTVISSAGRGEIRPIWEMIYNHYANRVGQGADIGYIAAFAAQLRPEGGPGGHATTFDQPGYGSLTFTIAGGSSSSSSSSSSSGGTITNGTYRITPRHSGKALDVANCGTANGTNVQQWTWLNNDCQKWVFTDAGSSQWRISPANATGQALDVNGCSTANSANVQTWGWLNNNCQKFTLVSMGSGYYQIKNVNSGKCLNISGSSTADGANAIQYTCSTANNMQFLLTKLASAEDEAITSTLANEMNIYPNPVVNGKFSIELPGLASDYNINVEIYSSEGRKMFGNEYAGTSVIEMKLSLDKGIYIVLVKNGNQLLTNKLIVE